MLQDLIKMVMEKTGLKEAMAKSVVDAILGHIKSKLPGPLGSSFDSLVGGGSKPAEGEAGESGEAAQGGVGGALGGVMKGLGGMFGK